MWRAIYLLVLAGIAAFFVHRIAVLNSFSLSLLQSPFDERSGLYESLPQSAIEAQQLLAHFAIKQFDLSPNTGRTAYLRSRIVEYSYPARYEEGALHVVAQMGEDMPECRVVGGLTRVVLYDCTPHQ